MTSGIMPVVTLQNGLQVGNFSSPHPFLFVDGTSLEACSDERARALMLHAEEVTTNGVALPGGGHVQDIDLEFRLSEEVRVALEEAQAADCDVVLVPFPVIRAMKEAGMEIGKCRVIRVADRVTKAIFTDRFCV